MRVDVISLMLTTSEADPQASEQGTLSMSHSAPGPDQSFEWAWLKQIPQVSSYLAIGCSSMFIVLRA